MSEEMEACPKCSAVSYGNIFCNTCLENYQNKFGKSEMATMIMEMNNKRNEIKPCPFCGGKASIQTSIRFQYVSCQNPECDSFGPNGLDEYEAIKLWNQRPYDYDMPAIAKKVQQLEKENEQLKAMLALGVNYERANG